MNDCRSAISEDKSYLKELKTNGIQNTYSYNSEHSKTSQLNVIIGLMDSAISWPSLESRNEIMEKFKIFC